MITTVGELIGALRTFDPDAPLAVAVGAYKAAPIRVDVRCMTPDQRANWWDNHQDPTCTSVVVLSETTRAA